LAFTVSLTSSVINEDVKLLLNEVFWMELIER
jgi:hypothetical protein